MKSFHKKEFIVTVFLLIFLGACGSPFGTTDDSENISSSDFCPFSTTLPDGTCPTGEEPAVTSSLALTPVRKPTWTWSSGGGGIGTYRYKLDDSDLSTGATETTATSFTPSSYLPLGAHALYVQEKDDAGNWSDSGNYSVQIYDGYFIKSIGGAASDIFLGLTALSNGGSVAIGQTLSNGSGSWDGLVVKFDAEGDVVWAKTIDGGTNDLFYEVVELSTGDLVAVGKTDGVAYDIPIVKLDKDGTMLWYRRVGGGGNDVAYSMIGLSSDDLLVVGRCNNPTIGGYDGLIVKLDGDDGTIIWDKSFGGVAHDFFEGVTELSDGSLVAVGYTESDGAGLKDQFIVKTSADGTFQWSKTFGSGSEDRLYHVTQLSDSNIMAIGSYDGDAAVIKITTDGTTLVWAKKYSTAGTGTFYGLSELSTGDLMLGGDSNEDAFILKLDSSGALLWGKFIGGANIDSFDEFSIASTGEFILAGYIGATGGAIDGGAYTDADALIVQLDEDGGLADDSSAILQDIGAGVSAGDIAATLDDAPNAATTIPPGLSSNGIAYTILDTTGAYTVTDW